LRTAPITLLTHPAPGQEHPLPGAIGPSPDSEFATLGLCEPLLKAIALKGYTVPSPIQLQCIPAVLGGRDVMAAAQTGTGKTAGFTLPMLEQGLKR
jgi:ATP-dependent RNA helicase RhlE